MPLPCTDTKPVGAADFYLAVNATFRFVLSKFGTEGLRRYWSELGSRYSAPVSALWRDGGMSAVAEYWRDFFAAEPGAEVSVIQAEDCVTVEVKVCPALRHLREHKREILGCFCQHCYFMNEAMAAPAGLTARVNGGNGSCQQTFYRNAESLPEQDLNQIKEVTPC